MRNKLFLVISVLIMASMALAACAPAPAPTAPPAEVVVETVVVTEVVEGETQTIVITATPAPEEPAPAEQPVLRVNLGSYPDIIDPQKSSFVNEIGHLQMIYEGLTKLDGALETVPGAAEKWEYNADATELTFTLRPDLKYSDGSLLNAKRYEYSILRNINPETAGEYAQITDDIAGAADWRSADPAAEGYDAEALKAGVKVQALDAAGNPCVDYEQADCLTLKIGLRQPAPYFHTVMSLWVTYPAKEELISEGGDNWWNSSKYQIGNGPFVLESLEPFVRGYFTPNPNYWEGQASYDLEYSYINDSAVAFEAYKNNEFDIIGLAAEDLGTVQADPQLSQEANIYPGSCTFAVMFHQLKEPFTDQKVREAFAMAYDRDGWVKDVLKDLGSPTLTWIPPGFPGYKEGETRWGYDPEAAKQALAESSYGGVEGLPPIELTFSDTPRNRTRYEWLAAKWKEVLGVEVTLNPVESTTYTALTKDIETAPLAFILGWCADYPDPQNWLSVYWKTGAFGERIGYSNPEFDALVDQADKELDPAKRADLYQQAQDLLVAGAPVAFAWNNVNTYLVKPWVMGLSLTPQDSVFPGVQVPLSITIDQSMMP
jgi:oligopeptide transport system substrate-binding protein